MNKQSTIAHIAWFFVILTGIVLSLKSLREPDLWWMYRTGEWMLENGQVTKSDPFSYTFAGVEWINVKWFFEVLIASGKNLFGPEFIFVFQGMVTVLLLTFLYKSSVLIQNHYNKNQGLASEEKIPPFAGLIAVGLLFLFSMDFRLIGRPEMTSHLMVSIYLFLFWKYYYEPSKLIFALIPLQILWANMHEAYGTGMVLMLAYLGASWVQFLYNKKKEIISPAPKFLSLAVLGALVGIVLNPRGIQMLWHPFEIFGQLDSNQFTTELASIWKSLYWEKEAYLSLFFLISSLLFIIITPYIYRKTITEETVVEVPAKGKNKKASTRTKATTKKAPLDWLNNNIQQYGLGNGLLYFMLFYLSTTAYRNIPFFLIAAAPILVVAVERVFQKINKPKLLYPLLLTSAVVFYASVVTGKYHDWTSSRDQYGLQVLSSHNPVGAAQFIKDNNITGRCFSDYLTSSYLLWKLQPEFKTYIDLRDLDIFPTDFFQDFAKTSAIPTAFDAKDDSLKFDYVVLFRPQFAGLHQHLVQSSAYDLVFADPVACVYLKNNSQHEALITKFGFTRNGFKDIFSPLSPVKSSSVPYWISKLLNPLYTPTNYSETDIDAIASSFYLSLKYNNLAVARANKSIQSGVEPWLGNELMGNIYNNLAFAVTTTDSLRKVYAQQAAYHYNQALYAKPDYVGALIGKATLSMQQQDFNTAIHLLNQVLDIDANDALALQYMGMCYKFLANQNNQDVAYVNQWLNYMLQLNKLNPDNPFILLDIGIAYCTLNNCPKAVEYLKNIMGVPNLPAEEFKTATRCMQKCG